MTAGLDVSIFLADAAPPFCSVEVAPNFPVGREGEAVYTLYLSGNPDLPFRPRVHCFLYMARQTNWAGARIIQGQWTSYANLLIIAFSAEQGRLADLESLKNRSGVSDQAWLQVTQAYPRRRCGDSTRYRVW
jgi:dipeptidyl-peptidase III